MTLKIPEGLEPYRILMDEEFSYDGIFILRGPCSADLKLIVSLPDERGWEHISVSTEKRIPNWLEMSWVKNQFWDQDDCVIQFHPPLSEYVNIHPNVLHLWRWTKGEFPMPPKELV